MGCVPGMREVNKGQDKTEKKPPNNEFETIIKSEEIVKLLHQYPNLFEDIPDHEDYHWNPNLKIEKDEIQDIHFKGEKVDGDFEGKVIIYDHKRGSLIAAVYENGHIKNNFARILLQDGSIYLGLVNQLNQISGQGIMKKGNKILKGYFKNAQIQGEGSEEEGSNKFQGEFRNGEKYRGKLINDQGIYQGSFKMNQKHGYGEFYWKNGGKYKGQFEGGLKEGNGKLYNTEGQLVRVGKWHNDEMIN